MDRAKPFDIPKREVWEAYKRVRANQGTAGVDEQSIADFEADLANNLYKLWNRLSSGSYHPPPVRRVDIPKGEGGGMRPLGIPTVADRIAQTVVKRLEMRFAQCGLTLHPDKTKVVYCKDDDRRGEYPDQKFDFLGYTFRPRLSRRWNGFGVSFSPAVSGKALKSIRQTVRHWTLHQRSDKTLTDLARMFNNHIRGWINYYGRFYKSMLYPLLRRINEHLVRWASRKYKRLHRREQRELLAKASRRSPRTFAHWRIGLRPAGWTTGAV